MGRQGQRFNVTTASAVWLYKEALSQVRLIGCTGKAYLDFF